MVESLLYGIDAHPHVSLSPNERHIIDASEVAIHVFWNLLFDVKCPAGWPANRLHASSTLKTVIAVFVTYQSQQAPLRELGIPGDTWVTQSEVYHKETTGNWTNWDRQFICPYDSHRVFGWSRSIQFKYLIINALRTDRRRWDQKDRDDLGVPWEYMPRRIREQSPEVVGLLRKCYDDLTKEDCVALLNIRCDYLRSQQSLQLEVKASRPELLSQEQLEALKYRTPLDHYQSSGQMQCPNGRWIFLPYTDRTDGEPESSDVFSCKWILSGADATAIPTAGEGQSALDKLPFVAVMNAPSPRDTLEVWDNVGDKITAIASTGRVSLVRDCATDGPQYSWDLRSLSAIMRRHDDGALINWQSARMNEELDKQGEPPQTIAGTLEGYIAASSVPQDSTNVLDIPTFGGEIPYLIRCVSTSSRALSSTANLCFLKSKAQPLRPCIPKPRRKVTRRGQDVSISCRTGLQANTANIEDAGLRERDAAVTANAADTTNQGVDDIHASREDRDAPSALHASADGTSTLEPRRSASKRTAARPVSERAKLKRRKVSEEGSPGIVATIKNTIKRGIAAIFKNTIINANSATGIHVLEWDAIRTASWAIVASTGAVSDTHPDAGGFLTWIKADVGAKIWAYILPIELAKDMKSAMEAYFNMVESNTDPRRLATLAVPVQTLLTPGMLV